MLQVSEQLSIFDFLSPELVQSCQDWSEVESYQIKLSHFQERQGTNDIQASSGAFYRL